MNVTRPKTITAIPKKTNKAYGIICRDLSRMREIFTSSMGGRTKDVSEDDTVPVILKTNDTDGTNRAMIRDPAMMMTV